MGQKRTEEDHRDSMEDDIQGGDVKRVRFTEAEQDENMGTTPAQLSQSAQLPQSTPVRGEVQPPIAAEEASSSKDGMEVNATAEACEEMVAQEVLIIAVAERRADISEIYSPPRVTSMADELGMQSGWALDLLNGWNFDKRKDRAAAIKLLKDSKPLLLQCAHGSALS